MLQDHKVLMSGIAPEPWSLETFRLHPEWTKHLTALLPSLIPCLDKRPLLGYTAPNGHKTRARRDVAFFSDTAGGYQLSKLSSLVSKSRSFKPFPLLAYLLREMNEVLGEGYTGIIVNHYENGWRSIGPHSDNPKGNGLHGVVTISLGATRIYRVSKVGDIDQKSVFDLHMEHGDVVLMKGAFQKLYHHSVPPEEHVMLPRTSLTFRRVIEDTKEATKESTKESNTQFNSTEQTCAKQTLGGEQTSAKKAKREI